MTGPGQPARPDGPITPVDRERCLIVTLGREGCLCKTYARELAEMSAPSRSADEPDGAP
jgi:hypothetical protein